MSLITFDNFYEEVKLFCIGQPKKADGLGVVISDPESEAAKTWIAYAEGKGWAHRAKLWKQMLKQGSKLTMPCADPKRFDPDYRGKAPMWTEKETTSEDPATRLSIGAQVRKVVADSRPPMQRRRGDNEPEKPKSPSEALADLKAKATSDPVMLSPRLADRLGIRPPAQDAAE